MKKRTVFASRSADSVALVTALYHQQQAIEDDEQLQELLAEHANNPAVMSMAFMTAMVLQLLPREVAEQFLQGHGLCIVRDDESGSACTNSARVIHLVDPWTASIIWIAVPVIPRNYVCVTT